MTPFARPSQASDALVLAAVSAGFQDCVRLAFAPSTPQIPNCPQASSTNMDASAAHYVENSDPMQGALVSFDTQHGDFAVTGSFDMNLNYTVNEPRGRGKRGAYQPRGWQLHGDRDLEREHCQTPQHRLGVTFQAQTEERPRGGGRSSASII